MKMSVDPPRCDSPVSSGHEKLKSIRACWLLLPVVIFILMTAYVFPFAVDDAYISLRYAENWANGYGPVFNPGERVEGYTNFLLVAVEMVLFKLGFEDLLPAKIFSILCGIALLGIVELFAWKRHKSILLATCAGLLVGTSAPLAFWAIGGLETALFTLLVTFGIILEIQGLQGNLPKCANAFKALVLFMAALTRPDAAIFVVLIAGCDLICSLRQKSWTGFLIFLVSFSVPALIYLAWKLHFYGAILPLPVYTKIPSHHLLYTFLTGGAKFLSFLAIDLNVVFVVGILYAMLMARSKGELKVQLTDPPFVLVAAATCVYALYLMSLGFTVTADEVYRYYVPLVPLMTVALVLVWPERAFFQHRRAVLVCVGLVCAMVGVRAFDLWWIWNKDWNFGLASWCFSAEEQTESLNQVNIAAGIWLRANSKPGDSIVLVDAGATPYFSKLRAIDVWSLNDSELARLKRLELAASSDAERSRYVEEMRRYVLSLNPTFILQDRLQLLKDPATKQKYKRVGPGSFRSPRPMHLKNTLNPCVNCRPGPYYVLELWKLVE
jgi:arabinofuranosyltransferase